MDPDTRRLGGVFFFEFPPVHFKGQTFLPGQAKIVELPAQRKQTEQTRQALQPILNPDDSTPHIVAIGGGAFRSGLKRAA